MDLELLFPSKAGCLRAAIIVCRSGLVAAASNWTADDGFGALECLAGSKIEAQLLLAKSLRSCGLFEVLMKGLLVLWMLVGCLASAHRSFQRGGRVESKRPPFKGMS